MKLIASPFGYIAAVLLATISLTSVSRGDADEFAQAPTGERELILVAQAPSPPAPAATRQGPGTGAGAKGSADNPIEVRITELHTELKITQSQEDLWSPVTQVMRDNEHTMEALHKARSQKATSMTAVEDVKSYAEIAQAHADGLEKFVPAFEALYNAMSDEQKMNADTIFGRRDPTEEKNTKSKRK